MSYPAYAETMASGVEWLGDVPKDWEVTQLKYVSAVAMGQSPPSDQYNLTGEGLPFLQGNAEFTDLSPVPKHHCTTAAKLSKPGDILLSVRAPVGAMNVSDQVYGIGRGLCAITPMAATDRRFLWHMLFHIREELAALSTGSTFDAVSVEEVRNTSLFLPPPSEQQQIAAFLDRKTAELDAVLGLKERQLELLAEKRQALISQAVTRGLDPTAPLKPSGIPWLGDVPGHWEIVPLKYLTKFINGAAFKPTDWKEEGTPIIRIENLNGGDAFNFSDAELHPRYLVQKGDLLFGWSGNRGTSFGPFLWQREGVYYLNQHIFRLDNYTFLKSFFYWLLRAVTQYVESEAHGIIGLVHITKEDLGNISVPVPQPNEQKLIADFIDTETARMDGIGQAIRAQIGKVREYRQALISAAVTGKIDVRNL